MLPSREVCRVKSAKELRLKFKTAIKALFVPGVGYTQTLGATQRMPAHFSVGRTIAQIDFLYFFLKVRIGKVQTFLQKFPQGLRHKRQPVHVFPQFDNV